MSSVSTSRPSNSSENAVEPDSFQEYLFTFFGVSQLKRMRNEHPGEMTLMVWGVTLDEYQNEVAKAIELVMRD